MFPELITRSDLEVFLPPIGGQTVYIFGPVEYLRDRSKVRHVLVLTLCALSLHNQSFTGCVTIRCILSVCELGPLRFHARSICVIIVIQVLKQDYSTFACCVVIFLLLLKQVYPTLACANALDDCNCSLPRRLHYITFRRVYFRALTARRSNHAIVTSCFVCLQICTVRVHDECNGSDVFGSDICTCRPYLVHGKISIHSSIEEPFKQLNSILMQITRPLRFLEPSTELFPRSIAFCSAVRNDVVLPFGQLLHGMVVFCPAITSRYRGGREAFHRHDGLVCSSSLCTSDISTALACPFSTFHSRGMLQKMKR